MCLPTSHSFNLCVNLSNLFSRFCQYKVELVKNILKCHRLFFVSCRNDTGVFVSDIVTGGIVEFDGRLLQGDQILSVNGEDVRTATQESVAALLKVNTPCVLFYIYSVKTICPSCCKYLNKDLTLDMILHPGLYLVLRWSNQIRGGTLQGRSIPLRETPVAGQSGGKFFHYLNLLLFFKNSLKSVK